MEDRALKTLWINFLCVEEDTEQLLRNSFPVLFYIK